MASAEAAITDRTRLVAVGYASNALGTINDVHQITHLAHAHGAWAFVDAVHYGPHGPIDVQDIGCDFLVCSSYKFFGPHLGILCARRALLDELSPPHVRPAGEVGPDKWELGTKSHESLSGLLGTISYLQSLSGEPAGERRAQLHDVTSGDRRAQLHDVMSRIKRYERSLSEQLIGGLLEIPGARIYGITDPAAFDRRVPTASFLFEGRDPYEVGRILGERGIFSWAGDHYAIEPLARLGLTATQRVGLVHYNTADEIERFLAALRDIVTTC
jgi:selenocysteine lyase/cysteine desulfurase